MTITSIILAAVVVGGTGLFIGVFLGIAGKKFAVEVDEREEAILGVLPPLRMAKRLRRRKGKERKRKAIAQ